MTARSSSRRRHRGLARAFRAGPLVGVVATACLTALTGGPAELPAVTDAPVVNVVEQSGTNTNCTLVVPAAPLAARGLATPYLLRATNPAKGPCHEANSDQSAFVEATILDPASGSLSVYHPLVIDAGTTPAVAPVVPTLPANAVVGVWFGYQADILRLARHRVRRGFMAVQFANSAGCVGGLPRSPFGQFGYCNAPRFFAAANGAIKSGKLTVPELGTARDGLPCPTTRDFSVVDQDQSDNLVTRYLAASDGRTAQFSAENAKTLVGATTLSNASDNGLLDVRLDPALGCTAFTAPDLNAGGVPSPSLALNELQAAAHQAAPVALVPPNDPMAVVNGASSLLKTDLYRAGVDQPLLRSVSGVGRQYCEDMANVAGSRLALDQKFTSAEPSPDPGVASDLFGFLAARLTASWSNLSCDSLTGHGPPVIANTGTAADPAAGASAAAATDPAVTGLDTAADPGTSTTPAPGPVPPAATGQATDPAANAPAADAPAADAPAADAPAADAPAADAPAANAPAAEAIDPPPAPGPDPATAAPVPDQHRSKPGSSLRR